MLAVYNNNKTQWFAPFQCWHSMRMDKIDFMIIKALAYKCQWNCRLRINGEKSEKLNVYEVTKGENNCVYSIHNIMMLVGKSWKSNKSKCLWNLYFRCGFKISKKFTLAFYWSKWNGRIIADDTRGKNESIDGMWRRLISDHSILVLNNLIQKFSSMFGSTVKTVWRPCMAPLFLFS